MPPTEEQRQQQQQADLSACEREPIHVPGRVQPHGVLLVVDGPDLRVRHASSNCGERLGVDALDLLGRSLDGLLGADADLLRSKLHLAPTDDVPALLFTTRPTLALGGNDGTRFHVLGHRRGGRVLLELEPAAAAATANDDEPGESLHAEVLASALRVQAQTTVRGLLDAAAREVRLLSGFDRVKVYRFDPDWHGEVVAEDKVVDWDSYLGHHFPASDIPQQARHLYTLNRVRLIPDAAYRPADVLPPDDPDTGEPLDLSYAALRSVSPVHAEYLRNMGVAASMSVSVVIDGRLWGLIACHHRTPRFLPHAVRSGCDHLGRVVAAQLAANERAEGQDHRLSLKAVQARLLERMAGHADFADGLLDEPQALLGLADAAGVAVRVGDRLHLLGETPGRDEVERLVGWLAATGRPEVFVTDALAREYPPAGAWADVGSGVLAVRLGDPSLGQDRLVWLRPEVVRTLVWAGDPDKPVAPPAPGGRIHPRRSFEAWTQVVRHRSRPWSRPHVEAAAEFRAALTNVVMRKSDELSHERRRRAEAEAANRAKDRFLAVLSHELRTPVSPVLLIAASMADDPALPPAVREDGRTILRNVAQQTRLIDDLLDVTRIEHGKLSLHPEPVDLHALLRDAVATCRADADAQRVGVATDLRARRHVVNGDPARLRQVFSNLLRNGVKFTPAGGRVTVRSADVAGGRVAVEVADTGLGVEPDVLAKMFDAFEQGGRAITDEFSGLGLGLAISKGLVEAHGGSIAAASGGRGRGTTMTVELPAAAAAAAQVTGVAPPTPAPPPPSGSPRALSILLVDDHHDTLRAMSRLLRRLDHRVTAADSKSAALRAAATEAFDLVISDVGLPDGTGLDLMRELVAQRPIRGIALTGYGTEGDIERTRAAGFSAHLTKPIDFPQLEAAIRDASA